MSKVVTPTTHVIFDYGGIVGDVVVFMYEFFQEIAAKNGKTIPESFKIEIAELDTLGQVLKKVLEITDLDQLMSTEFCKEVEERLLNSIKTKGFPMVSGVHKLIKHLYENNIPIAIATNGKMEQAQIFLHSTIGLNFELFSHCVSGGDDLECKNNKPAPDVYLVCAKRFKSPPKSLDSCVIFEDSIRGITGAVNTGMKTVFLNEIQRPKQDFQTIADKITVIIDSFDNFQPESVGLPPYPR